MWLLPLFAALAGTMLLAWLAARVRRAIGPAERTLRGFGHELRPALVEVRDEAARLRARLAQSRES
jgi:hypothetical protein